VEERGQDVDGDIDQMQGFYGPVVCPRYDWLVVIVKDASYHVSICFVSVDMSKLEYTPLNEIEEVRIC
jgi:hypothetical protein